MRRLALAGIGAAGGLLVAFGIILAFAGDDLEVPAAAQTAIVVAVTAGCYALGYWLRELRGQAHAGEAMLLAGAAGGVAAGRAAAGLHAALLADNRAVARRRARGRRDGGRMVDRPARTRSQAGWCRAAC